MKLLTILIVDNHPISRTGLKLALETAEGFKIIGEAASGQQAIKLCQEIKPNIVLMDINMPNGNGIEATQILHRQFPEMIIIAVSGFRHEEMQREVMQVGAAGYISKETDFTEMITIIREIVQGREATPHATTTTFELTHMEQRVLSLLAEGYDRQQIADQLTISINTVKMHFRNLYQKLGVANAHDAIMVAIQNNLIS